MKLNDRVAVVTGAASGIGRATAQAFADAGAQVCLADINAEGGEAAVSEIRASGGKARFLRVDVTDDASVDAFARQVLAEAGRVDVLANVAGWGRNLPFVDTTVEYWEQVIGLNLYGPMRLSKAFVPGMIERQSGRIINVSSDAGRVGSLGETPYSGAKAGVIGFTKALAREVARYNVTVNCICPGPTDTPLMAATPDKIKEGLTRAIPMRRIGRPQEVANAILFFGSDRSSYCTGQVLSVSGGLTMAG